MSLTTGDRTERILDYAEGADAGNNITDEKRKSRREFGRGFVNSLDEVHKRMKNGTLHELPSVSSRMSVWKKWAEELDDE